MKIIFIVTFFCFCTVGTYAQEPFKIIFQHGDFRTHYIADVNDSILLKLDSTFVLAFQPENLSYFHVFLVKGRSGWWAINSNAEILFSVHNTDESTLSPDELSEGFIRIEDEGKIGFANVTGEVVIQPQFEKATSFKNGFAIVGSACEKVQLSNEHTEENCQHYSINCAHHGYINKRGELIQFGAFTFEEIEKLIQW